MSSSIVDLVKVNITSSGNGPFTLSTAVSGYRGTEALTNGLEYGYSVQENSNWEVGRGTWLSATNQLSRSPIYSSNGGAAVPFSVNAQVAFVALAEDLDSIELSSAAVQAENEAAASAQSASESAATAIAALGGKANSAAIGILGTDNYLPNFTGSTIPDNSTAVQALQALETAVEALPAYGQEYPFFPTTTQTVFTSPVTLKANPAVYVNGARLTQGDYTWMSTGITLATAAGAGDTVVIVPTDNVAQSTVNVGNVIDLGASSAAALVGADDGASGSLWTTVKGFINYLRSSVGAAIVGFTQAGTGAVMRSVQIKLRETASPEDYGAVGDGVADDTAAILAAAAAAKNVVFGAKAYKVTSISITSGSVRFKGAGRGITRVVTSSTTANVFSFGGTAFDCSVEDMTIDASVTQTAGAGVAQTNGTGNIRVNNVRIQNTFNGVSQVNGSVAGVLSLSNVDISGTKSDAVYVNGNSQLFAENLTTYGNLAGSGFHCVAASGVYVSNATIQDSAGFGVSLTTTSTSAIFDAYFTNVEIDACADSGLVLDASAGGAIYNIQFVNSRAGYCGGDGAAINGAQNVTLSASSFYKNTREGIDAINLTDSIITGCQVLGNSASGAGYQGINIKGGSGITVTDNRVGPYHATGNNQAFGVAVQSTFSGAATIKDNDLRGNVSGGIANASTSTTVIIADNQGYNPVGLAIVSVGASPFAYTAGATPEDLYIRGGTVTDVKITAPNGTLSVFNATSGCTINLAPYETCTVTYSAAPTIVKNVR